DREGMNRCENARAHEEGAEQAQAESEDREQKRPAHKDATPDRGRERMDESRAREPGQERRVLNRVPEPETAPAELVIGPPRSHRDAESKTRPRRQCPGAQKFHVPFGRFAK